MCAKTHSCPLVRVLLGEWRKGSGPAKVGSGFVRLLRLQGAQELPQKGHAYQSIEQQSLLTRSMDCSAPFVFGLGRDTNAGSAGTHLFLSFLSIYSFLFPFHLCLFLKKECWILSGLPRTGASATSPGKLEEKGLRFLTRIVCGDQP